MGEKGELRSMVKRSVWWVLQSTCSASVTVPGAGDTEVSCLQMQGFHSLFRALEIPCQ